MHWSLILLRIFLINLISDEKTNPAAKRPKTLHLRCPPPEHLSDLINTCTFRGQSFKQSVRKCVCIHVCIYDYYMRAAVSLWHLDTSSLLKKTQPNNQKPNQTNQPIEKTPKSQINKQQNPPKNNQPKKPTTDHQNFIRSSLNAPKWEYPKEILDEAKSWSPLLYTL